MLEDYADIEWTRLAITDVQVQIREHGLVAIDKLDHRYSPVLTFPAVETEALSQREIERVLRADLDAMLPEQLAAVLESDGGYGLLAHASREGGGLPHPL